jgi:hypothetical protein
MPHRENAHRDPRIDAYIAKAESFARPILEYVRALVHEGCPGVEETIKWGMPSFVHAGAILCGVAAFKRHASFGFWKHAEVVGEPAASEGMGGFGKLASIDDLPAKRQLLVWVRKAARLNEARSKDAGKDGASPKPTGGRKTATSRPLPEMPTDFADALRAAPKAQATFDAFAPSHRREYLEWVIEAKREETRVRRIAQAIEWLGEGKSRHWKYERC